MSSDDDAATRHTRVSAPAVEAGFIRAPKSLQSFGTGPDDRLPVSVSALTSGLCIVVALTALLVWGTIATARAGDSYLVNHVSGHRMALARYMNEGILYPPFYDGRHYGGTRIMPLSIVLHATAARLTGEYLRSGKLLSCLTLLALVTVTGGVLWRLGYPLPLAAVLATTVLITAPGYRVGLSGLTADGLSVLLQLLAMSTVVSSRGRTGAALAGLLSALALMSKFSAMWAPMAIGAWLAFTSRARLWVFVSTYVVLVVGLLGAVTAASNGRFLESFLGLSFGGIDGISAGFDSPTHFIRTLFGNTPVLWALVPAGVLAVAVSFARRTPSIYDVGLLCQLPLLLVIFADIGAGDNHLLDLFVLAVLAIAHVLRNTLHGAGALPAASAGFRRQLTVAQSAAAMFAVWITATHVVIHVPDVHDAVAVMRAGDDTSYRPLARWLRVDNTILSEDPFIPVALGQLPVVTDPFMLLRIGRSDPAAVQALIRRIDDKEFDFVVLLAPVERTWWWEKFHFGLNVIESIERAYEFSVYADGYYLYTPAHE